MNHELRTALDRVAHRLRLRRRWAGLGFCWAAWWLVGLALLGTGPHATATVALVAGLATASTLGWLWACREKDDPRRIATHIEVALPDLDAALLTAVDQELTSAPGPRGYLRQAVIERAVEHGRGRDWATAVVPPVRFAGLRLGRAAAGLAALTAFGLLAIQSREFVAPPEPPRPPDLAAAAADLQVVPGDAEIERGTPLLVVARFGSAVPPEAKLVVEGAPARPMARSLEDPAFAGRVESVDADLAYHVEFGAGRSPTYKVRVFEHPELTRIDADLTFPAYTGFEPKKAEDVRHVSAVEGTDAAFTFRLNKPVASAALVDENGWETPLEPTEPGAATLATSMKLAETHRYKVRLVDADGRPNKLTAELAVNVAPNRPPTVALAAPGRDVRVSPVEELTVKAKADDDFGVVRQGISFTHAGSEPREVVLTSAPADAAKGKKVEFGHLIDFESLRASPDELVSYFAWAEDVGPDGSVRRAEGDMFFAEVRHFEEIFRQGEQESASQQQQQQQGGQGQQAEQLAELQKQVVNGTWKVVRRETKAEPTAEFAGDVKTLHESQQGAIEQAGAMAGQLRDETSKQHMAKAVEAMNDAATKLGAAADPAALRPALAAEQAAYQALLKLRAREFQVSRGRQRGQGKGGNSQQQRQLDQLELKDDENRYEEQSQAKSEEATQKEREAREDRQVANRLRELAQRQSDLNARLKELQSALEAARDEPTRQEIERQLKRLREQQQQILRDADELRERMEQEQNRDRMAEARRDVEQGREHARQASEALEQGRLSQALTEGARAGEQLDKVREEMRKRSSNQFSEEMSQMRDQARRLDEEQEKLTERLAGDEQKAAKSLRSDDGRKGLEQGLARQREDLEKLVDRMKGTVHEAEESEPLLARSLFDAARKVEEQGVPDALREAEKLAQLGVPEEAAKSSDRAGKGIDQLREGVEKAARSVLGDETAALRRAEAEVDQLAYQLDREIAQATGGRNRGGRPEDRPGERSEGTGAQQRPDARTGQPGEQDRQQGQQPGQGQGQQEGQQPGQGQSQRQEGQQPGQGQREGEQPGQGQQEGQQPGQGQGQEQEGQQPGQGQGQQEGQQPGQEGQGEQPGQGQQQQGGGDERQGQQQQRQGGRGGGRRQSAGDRLMDGLADGPAAPGQQAGPIRGEGFRQWSDRMREVEELLEDPELRAEAARIRDRVRGTREEFKKHAGEPDWTQLQQMVADPIHELRDRIAEEVRRREEPDSLVPIDRDPVPPRFAEGVRRYYERLGSGR